MMKAQVLESIGNLVYKDVEKPIAKPGEVLLEIKACGICSSDVDRVMKTGTYHFPTIPGHEFAGVIVDVGAGVDHSYLGKRATAFPLLPCFECPSCLEKAYQRCDNYQYFGSRNDGAFAEYLAIPTWNIKTFANNIPYEVAAMTEPASVAMKGVRNSKIKQGDTVAIIGNGTIGYFTAAWAKEMGAKRIIMYGRNDLTHPFEQELGIDYVFNSQKENYIDRLLSVNEGDLADLVFECVGSNESITSTLDLVKKGGQVILVGNPYGDVTLARNQYWKILRNEINIQGVWNSKFDPTEPDDWDYVLNALAEERVDLSPLITHRFTLANTLKGFTALQDRNEQTVKVMITNE